MYIRVCFLFVKKKSSGFRGTMRIESNEDHKSGGWFWTWVVRRTPGRGVDSWRVTLLLQIWRYPGTLPSKLKEIFKGNEHLPIVHFWYQRSIFVQEAETVQCTWVVLETLVVSSFMSLLKGVDVCIVSWCFPWLLMAEFRHVFFLVVPIATGLSCHPS